MNLVQPRTWGNHRIGALTVMLSATIAGVTLQLGTTVAAADNGASSPLKSPTHRMMTTAGRAVSTLASTIPANGDVNPYGVAVVPRSVGRLHAGHILVSNFNNAKNQQGTGSTIVDISPGGAQTLFATIDPARVGGSCPGGGIGLTTALVVLRSGWVIVGSLPAADGTPATAQPGCLLILNPQGAVVKTIAGRSINGPWDMTAIESGDRATLFVSNVLNGTVAAQGRVVNTGTIVRIVLNVDDHNVPRELSRRVIATGFADRSDPAALVLGQTGLGLSQSGTLYVADTLNNRIVAIPHALTRRAVDDGDSVVSVNGALNAPLGLVVTRQGHILTVNGNDGNMVETLPDGKQVAVRQLDATGDPPGAGTLFGLALAPRGGVYFVDDGSNSLNVLRADEEPH